MASDDEQSQFVVCELEPQWLDDIVRIENACYSNPWSRELLANEFKKNVSFRLAVRAGDLLVAHSFNHLVIDELHVLNLAVDPQWRCRGVGTLLLGSVLAGARERGGRNAYLEVRTSNSTAQSLYERFGFRRVGVRHRYYADNQEDALVYVCDLKNTGGAF